MDLETVVTTTTSDPPRYSSHGLDTHVMGDTVESLRPHSPAPAPLSTFPPSNLTSANNDDINTSYSPNPLTNPERVQSPPPPLRRTLTRLPTYRSAILPPYSRWGRGDKYATLRDLEAQGLSTERPRCLQYGWRIWLVVVAVIVVTVVTIAVAVTKAASKSG